MTNEAAWRQWIASVLPPGPQFASLRRQMKSAFMAGIGWGRANGVVDAANATEEAPKRKRVVRKRRT